jgi:hypothetical protein
MPYIGQARRGLPSAQVSNVFSDSLILPSRPLPARNQVFESIATATGTGSTSSITLNSGGVWANYRHLYVVANLSHTGGGWVDGLVRANGISSNYSILRHFNYFGSSVLNISVSGSAAATDFGGGKIAESAGNNITSLDMWFFEHNNSNMVLTRLMRDNATVKSNSSTDYQSGVYGSSLPSATQLTSLTFSMSGGGNFSSASEIMIYGIKE